MTEDRRLHEDAMRIAHEAFLLKRNDPDSAIQLFEQAFELERRAAEIAKDQTEPTRSVLFRSAATLALHGNQYREAERSVAAALIGNPPSEIVEELRDLLEEIYFRRHLELRGVKLSETELQLSLAGPEVGFGTIRGEEFVKRLEVIKKISYRIAERRRELPFRGRGAIPKDIRELHEPYVSVPRVASFAVTIRFGSRARVIELFDYDPVAPVVTEIVSNVELVQNEAYEELLARIKDETYFYNMVALTRELAPNLSDVHLVGLTSQSDGVTRTVELTKSRKEIRLPRQAKEDIDETAEHVEISGKLMVADRLADSVTLLDTYAEEHTIAIPEGAMADIVRPYWEREVTIIGERVSGVIHFEDIVADE